MMETDGITGEDEEFTVGGKDSTNAVEMGDGGNDKRDDFLIPVRWLNAAGMLAIGKGCGSVEKEEEKKWNALRWSQFGHRRE